MNLDSLLDGSKVAGDLLVEPPGDDVGQDFAFPGRQQRNFCSNGHQFRVHLPSLGVVLLRARNRRRHEEQKDDNRETQSHGDDAMTAKQTGQFGPLFTTRRGSRSTFGTIWLE